MGASRMITGLIGAFGGGAVGRMLGGRTGGMIGSMAGSMLARGGGGGLGSMLGGLMGKNDDEDDAAQLQPAAQMSDDDAIILLQAMCNSAKADGSIDEDEIQRIMGHMGDMDKDEEALLRQELTAPLDLEAFVRSVPAGQENDVYAASLLPITIDEASEVEYLRNLASGLGLTAETVNAIHAELGLN